MKLLRRFAQSSTVPLMFAALISAPLHAQEAVKDSVLNLYSARHYPQRRRA